MVKEITPEKTIYLYYTQAEGVPEAPSVAYESQGELWHIRLGAYAESLPVMEPYLASSRDTRLTLVPSFYRPGTADVHYLFWNDGTDLETLDDKIAVGAYEDVDFRSSIRTEYNKTRCDVCHREWDTLVVDTGNPYIGSPGLLQDKLKRHSILRCWDCQSYFRLFVVKILE